MYLSPAPVLLLILSTSTSAKMKGLVLSSVLALAPLTLALAAWPEAEGKDIKYTSVPGYFLQDDNSTDPTGFDYAAVNFGLINRTYPTDKHFDPEGVKTQWQRFDHWVQYLNSGCRKSDSVQYKLLFMGRHGEGWHNAAESFYGTPAWNCYWAEQDGNATARWADPLLTPAGANEALKANAYFKDRYATQKMPYFESYYTSPLIRCGYTANITFGDIPIPADEHPFVPVVKEGFREGMTVHTCNWRSNKTYIASTFPSFEFEPGFAEYDQLWRRNESETSDAQDARSKAVLDDVFRADDKTWLSITSHSGEITKLLKALNHRAFRLSTGQIIPVFVKAEVVAPAPVPTFAAHEPYSTCTSPPVTSIAGQGCVCATTASSGLLPAATLMAA
ncbi:phosphoglycerate mutase [Colletotrichum scovillei]|uniref:Phosphoglycerate mutase n=1 Tax=Colletotrichum scovillei TaxID=1209932 RepID=A0A9P7REG1_9PEZI|nr:phosphoglycerate mutase [Colletotrichum scovillei]KAF4772892.1 phosphoglycerate mutase [Colletotrichum scovillei]KAG7054526.1 phosphoglycerate mutase [Colletotrichum scovillei]KAG7073970.1 phosphoglycerate mutase [Colletotrichum scovillei]KAG7081279.1 phosphoglycerate mutase [Colletotrichum scovillei]